MQFTRIASECNCNSLWAKPGHEQQCTAWSFFFFYYLVFHLLWPASGDCVDLFCAALRCLFISQETQTTTEVTTKLQSASWDGQTMANMPQSTLHKETATTTVSPTSIPDSESTLIAWLDPIGPVPDQTRPDQTTQWWSAVLLSEMEMRFALYKLS